MHFITDIKSVTTTTEMLSALSAGGIHIKASFVCTDSGAFNEPYRCISLKGTLTAEKEQMLGVVASPTAGIKSSAHLRDRGGVHRRKRG